MHAIDVGSGCITQIQSDLPHWVSRVVSIARLRTSSTPPIALYVVQNWRRENAYRGMSQTQLAMNLNLMISTGVSDPE